MARNGRLGWASAICALLMVATSFSMVVMAGGNNDDKVRVIVVFKDTVDEKTITDIGGEILNTFTVIPAVVTELTANDIKTLNKSDKVKSVEEDEEVELFGDGKDQGNKGGGKKFPPQPAQSIPWGIERIGADDVWGSNTGSGVNVAILDTGICLDHPDLEANIKGGINIINPKKPDDYGDGNGHGTHCAGIVAACNNDIGVVGVAPGAGIFSVRVLNNHGGGFISDIAMGIYWVIDWNDNHDDKIKIISMSLGLDHDFDVLRNACDAAYDRDILIVAAAGNEGGPVCYPAAYSYWVLAVSATDQDDSVPAWSNYGDEIDLAAPGVGILSTTNGRYYAERDGTSMSCPHVSGAAALVIAHPIDGHDIDDDGIWDPDEIGYCLENSAEEIIPGGEWNEHAGYGLVNAYNAVDTG